MGAGWRLSGFATDFNELSDGSRVLRLAELYFSFDLVRTLRFSALDVLRYLHGSDPTRIVYSWRQIKATIFMCGPDAWVAGDPDQAAYKHAVSAFPEAGPGGHEEGWRKP